MAQPYRPTSSLKGGANQSAARPMSSINKAGFGVQQEPGQMKSPFDDLPQEDPKDAPDKVAEAMELEIYICIRDAMNHCDRKEYSIAVARLTEAQTIEGKLRRHHFTAGNSQMINPEHQIVIKRHLCQVYTAYGQYDQALQNYERIIKQVDKQTAADIRCKMGDIYQMKRQYQNAIKNYQQALDLAPPEYARLRQKISRQIALSYTRIDKWQDAVNSIEDNLVKSLALVNSQNQETDRQNIYALATKFDPIYTQIVCYYAMGEQKKMLDTFKKLIETCTLIGDNPELFGMGEDEEDFMMTDGILNNGGDDELDELSKYNAGQRHQQRNQLLQVARLIAPSISYDPIKGYEKLAELLKEKGHQSLSLQVQMSKALMLLNKGLFEDASKAMHDIDREGLETALAMGINVPQQVLQRSKGVSLAVAAAAEAALKNEEQAAEALGIDKSIIKQAEKNSKAIQQIEKDRATSARNRDITTKQAEQEGKSKVPYATFVPRGVHTNISFISYLKGDYENALQHANTAIMIDPYDSFAHINLGCAYYATNNIDTALKEFNEASEINPDAIQGLYNAGMVFFRRQDFDSAFVKFQKVVGRMASYTDAIFMSAECLIKMTRVEDAVVLLNSLVSIYGQNAQDPGVFARLGELYHILGEESQGAHYFKEAHRLIPYNIDYIKWLGSYYVRQELYEQARLCFEKGAEVDYLNPTWNLSAAACLRKTNQMREALSEYRKILKKWPTNMDAIKFLVVCLNALNMTDEAVQWTQKYDKLKGVGAQNNINTDQAVLDPKVVKVDDRKVIEDKPDAANEDIFGNENIAADLLREDAEGNQ